jgi:hypothetical protein
MEALDDFCIINHSCEITNIVTEISTTTSQGGLLSPLYRLLFGSTVCTKFVTTTIITDSVMDSHNFEKELEELLLDDLHLEPVILTIKEY